MPKQGIARNWSAHRVNADGKGWSTNPQGDKNAGGSLSVLGHNLLADNEGSGVTTRSLSVVGISTTGALILSWVGVRTSIFAGPPTANNGNTCTQDGCDATTAHSARASAWANPVGSAAWPSHWWPSRPAPGCNGGVRWRRWRSTWSAIHRRWPWRWDAERARRSRRTAHAPRDDAAASQARLRWGL